MLDLIRQCIENFTDRIRSPILGSVTIAFFAFNWKAFYFLFFAEAPTWLRVWYFEQNTDLHSLFSYPIVGGISLALIKPWVTYAGSWVAKFPNFFLYRLQQSEARRRRIEELRLEAEYEEVKAQHEAAVEERVHAAVQRREEVALERAKLDQRISEVHLDTDIAESLQRQIDKLRTMPARIARDGRDRNLDFDEIFMSLGEMHAALLKGIKDSGGTGNIDRYDDKDGSAISAGKFSLEKRDVGERVWQEYIEAISDLEHQGALRAVGAGSSGTSWEVTALGHDLMDSL